MKPLLSLFFAFFLTSAHAQLQNEYVKDLISLRKVLEKTISYKHQIRGQALKEYNQLFEKLKADSGAVLGSHRYFYNLAQLFFPIQDNHLAFYQIDKFTKASDFPTFHGNLDSLSAALQTKSLDSVEGIYHYGGFYQLALFQSKPKEYIGVVVNSKTPIWKNGEIAAYLYETAPQYFRGIYLHSKFKNYTFCPVEKYQNHALVNSKFYSSFYDGIYTKENQTVNHVNLTEKAIDFQFKTINSTTQYLQIRHFSANPNALKASQAFLNSVKDSIHAQHLILDLRNNDGGSYKASNLYLKVLKAYAKKGQIYILINNGTLSQGEIFTLQLKALNHVQVLGQTSKGMLTYGSNYGKREKLQSQAFEVYLTDMYGAKKFLSYENYGISPDITLTNSSDWIEQAVQHIEQKQQAQSHTKNH